MRKQNNIPVAHQLVVIFTTTGNVWRFTSVLRWKLSPSQSKPTRHGYAWLGHLTQSHPPAPTLHLTTLTPPPFSPYTHSHPSHSNTSVALPTFPPYPPPPLPYCHSITRYIHVHAQTHTCQHPQYTCWDKWLSKKEHFSRNIDVPIEPSTNLHFSFVNIIWGMGASRMRWPQCPTTCSAHQLAAISLLGGNLEESKLGNS